MLLKQHNSYCRHRAERIHRTGTTEQLFTLISKRMQAVGKFGKKKRYTGNANKRLKFTFSEISARHLLKVARGSTSNLKSEASFHLSLAEIAWAEGKPSLVWHLRRERASGLAQAKKKAFLRENGRLFCERCKFDPVANFGDRIAEACIEVHHRETQVADMEDQHITRLEDLQCLCANCHRLVHAILRQSTK